MPIRLRHRPASGYHRTRWKNGGGWTTEIAVEPEHADLASGFDWRVSIAEIEQDGPFSQFPGIERDLFLLDGAGMDLRIDGQDLRVDQPLQRVHFDGNCIVECQLLDGPTRDFNVLVRASRTVAFISGRSLPQPVIVAGPAGSQWLVHPLDGTATITLDGVSHSVNGGDSLQLDGGDEAAEFAIASSGELIVIRFTPRSQLD